jgi:DNA mismatch repair ATPase MutS
MIISSPNKSGKTTILKASALNIIFSQQVGCGFYQSATITPYTHIHSYLNIPDTSGRDSLFQAESRRCKEIIDSVEQFVDSKYRHFCMFDELYSGTNPTEAAKAGYAFLEYLQRYSNVDFILTTHYLSICKKFKCSTNVQNYKMLVHVNPDGTFKYTYKIKKGISKLKGGIRVLKDMNYPEDIINTIESSR